MRRDWKRGVLLLLTKHSVTSNRTPPHDRWEMQVMDLGFSWNYILVMKCCFLILHAWKTERHGAWLYSGISYRNMATKKPLEANTEKRCYRSSQAQPSTLARRLPHTLKPITAMNETADWNFTTSRYALFYMEDHKNFLGYFCSAFFEPQKVIGFLPLRLEFWKRFSFAVLHGFLLTLSITM